MSESIWDEEKLIGEVVKNKKEVIRVKKVSKNGKSYRDVRVYYKTEDGEYNPSGKGIVIPEDKINDIIDLLESDIK